MIASPVLIFCYRLLPGGQAKALSTDQPAAGTPSADTASAR